MSVANFKRMRISEAEYHAFMNSTAWLAVCHELRIAQEMLISSARKCKDRDARLALYDEATALENMISVGKNLICNVGEKTESFVQDEAKLREHLKGDITCQKTQQQ